MKLTTTVYILGYLDVPNDQCWLLVVNGHPHSMAKSEQDIRIVERRIRMEMA